MRLLRPGAITEIVGRSSSGRTSLFTACLGEATAAGGVAALVDADETFDPASAARAGVDLARLLWVRCAGRRDAALRATDLLVRCPGFALVGLDLGEAAPPLPPAAAFRLKFAVERTGAALVIVGRRRVAGAGASLVVETVRAGLEWEGPGLVPTRLARLVAGVRVLRARAGAPAAGAAPVSFCA
ncbi:MAG: hypothetical protein HYS37_04530 [Candidatus Rokubacteria bacterium]|nr:hypothetical protein [Candidatus Rokubacteria bacterium]